MGVLECEMVTDMTHSVADGKQHDRGIVVHRHDRSGIGTIEERLRICSRQ